MKIPFKIFSLIFLINICICIPAQNQVNNTIGISVNSYPGYIVKTYPDVPDSKGAIINSLGVYWQTNGKDEWQQLYRFPKYGFELFYSHLGNNENLGYNIGFVPTFEIKGRKEKKNWRIKLGLGAAYFNKPFNAVSNPNNFYIGGPFANMSIASFFWTRRISKIIELTYGIAGIHCSNGHTDLPNAGMNIISGHLGIRFSTKEPAVTSNIINRDEKISYAVKAGLGFHKFGATTKAVGGPSYPSYHLSFWVSKPKKNIHLFQAGFTAAYYTSFHDYIVSQQVYSDQQQLRSSTGILFAGHEFVFGKFSFSSQLGIYFYNPFFIKQKKIEGSWSNVSEKIEAINTNRLGLIYYPLKKKNSLNNLKDQLMLGVFIKANLGQADLFEYCIGYVF